MNQKGFAITGVLYVLLMLFLVSTTMLLFNLQNRKTILDQLKIDVASAVESDNNYEYLLNKISELEAKVGNTDTSSIGNGTITGALASINEITSKNGLIFTTDSTNPCQVIKDNWDSLPAYTSTGYINTSGASYAFIFFRASNFHGTGIIYGYSTGAIWHVYRDGNYYYEPLSTSSGAVQF